MTRLLRREVFEELARQPHPAEEPYKMVLFGSSVVQSYRPFQGYPIRRLARDIDVGIVLPEGEKEFASKSKEAGQRLMEAARAVGAEVIPDSVKYTSNGFKGCRIRKCYSPEFMKTYLHGKLEEDMVRPTKPLDAELDVSEVFQRYPLLPLKPSGENGFYHEDIREVIGTKLYRMVTAGAFQLRDIMDVYNILSIKTIDPEKDGKILRTIALVSMAANGITQPTVHISMKNLEPTDENIKTAMESLGVDDYAFMKHVYETVLKAVHTIFKERGAPLPGSLNTPLHFTLNEVNFFAGMRGREFLPGSTATDSVNAGVYPALLVDEELEKQFPGLRNQIDRNQQLQSYVKDVSLSM